MSITALAKANATTRILRILNFIICSDEEFPKQPRNRIGSGHENLKNRMYISGKTNLTQAVINRNVRTMQRYVTPQLPSLKPGPPHLQPPPKPLTPNFKPPPPSS